MRLHAEPLERIDPITLYRLLKLRVDVFVVEQRCAYPELDGRDAEPGARQFWLEEDGEVLATLRLLPENAGTDAGTAATTVRIGRVATAGPARSRGLAARLLAAALAESGTADVVLDAQSHLAGWYGRFGFVASGPEFVEDGIPHLPMRRSGG
ncbi:MAG TPA: GNAT family N-acetyltransferase [Jatrophihabitans sp.]|nr:GNAT family N-acetyltransferase [Jatrophihabitans sp.]